VAGICQTKKSLKMKSGEKKTSILNPEKKRLVFLG